MIYPNQFATYPNKSPLGRPPAPSARFGAVVDSGFPSQREAFISFVSDLSREFNSGVLKIADEQPGPPITFADGWIEKTASVIHLRNGASYRFELIRKFDKKARNTAKDFKLEKIKAEKIGGDGVYRLLHYTYDAGKFGDEITLNAYEDEKNYHFSMIKRFDSDPDISQLANLIDTLARRIQKITSSDPAQ